MHDISDINHKPDSEIPCLGCGQKDGLISPIQGKKKVLWCMRCGTLIDTEESPMDSLVPQLCIHTLSAFGYAAKTPEGVTHQPQTAEGESQASEELPDSGT